MHVTVKKDANKYILIRTQDHEFKIDRLPDSGNVFLAVTDPGQYQIIKQWPPSTQLIDALSDSWKAINYFK